MGRLAAQLNAFTDCPYPYPIAVEGTIEELTEAARQYPFQRAMCGLVAELAMLAQQPASFIHGEINTANALLTPTGRMVLLDWDAAGTGPALLEVGYPLLTTFLDEDLVFHADWAAAYYSAYTQGAGMPAEQKDLLFTAGLLHALRYMGFANTLRAGPGSATPWSTGICCC